MKSRIEQREDLMIELGLLVDPIRRFIIDGGTVDKVPWIRSQFTADLEGSPNSFCSSLASFSRVGSLTFNQEYVSARRTLFLFAGDLDSYRPDNKQAALDRFNERLKEVQKAIHAIPCDDPNFIFPANSPFQTYLRLRAICSSVVSRLDLLDAYLDASVFHRYLAEVPPSVPVTLVTSEDNMTAKRGRLARRRRELVAVSELFAAERPATYRFVVSPSLHDRHLRADSAIYHLGGSIKDAAAKDHFTLSKHASSETDASLDAIIAGAVEWFGPNTPKHRRR